MSQQYFTDSEWETLLQAPVQAAIGVTLVDKTDPVSFLNETRTAIQILAAEQQRQDISSDLARSLVTSLKEEDAKEALQGDQLLLQKQFELLGALQGLKSASDGRKSTLEYFKQIESILASKVTAVQAAEFKSWILSIARQVAEAVKEGGLFGVGGERVSREEAAMLSDMEKALNFKS
ncbi:MAG TPA: hypothetical protein V6C57_23815 [Coleofasciculaceae cyanobacterium]